MKISKEIVIFLAIMAVSLFIVGIGTAVEPFNPNTIPDDVLWNHVTSIRGIQDQTTGGREPDNGALISSTLNMKYVMVVNITGSPTWTFSGTTSRHRQIPIMLNSNLDAKGINLQVETAIQNYAKTTWNVTLLNGNWIKLPYSK